MDFFKKICFAEFNKKKREELQERGKRPYEEESSFNSSLAKKKYV